MDRFLATMLALVCLLFLVRLALGPARQQRLDAVARRSWRGALARLKSLSQWRSRQQQRQRNKTHAEQATRDAIERARRGAVERDGNVIRPKAFKGKKDTH